MTQEEFIERMEKHLEEQNKHRKWIWLAIIINAIALAISIIKLI